MNEMQEIPVEELAALDEGISIEEHQHIDESVELLDEDTLTAQAAFTVPGVVLKDVRNSLKKGGTYYKRTLASIRNIVVHHSATVTGSAEAYANYHVGTLKWPGIGYHIVIEQDGTVKLCNDLDRISYHVGNANSYSVGVSMTGDFSKNEPTTAQWGALYKVLEALRAYLPNAKAVTSVIGHQEAPGYASKQCPSLDMDSMRGQLQNKTYGKVKNKFSNDQAIKVLGGGIVPATPTAPTATTNVAGTIKVLVNDLWYYSKPDWNAKKATVGKNEVFTVVQELTIAGYKMYKLKSGNYITANSNYVKFTKK